MCSGAICYLGDKESLRYYQKLATEFPLYPNPSFHQIEVDLERGTMSEESI